ncbi:hypothetical protein F2P81_022749 [Scophthalmus maximus]|uniref:Receptor activity-modifying protein 2 n=1 Tax=Scophthalmus maximus TaxID=52904 RepID=A0A6A4S151_SCOMX|nr:hypothetical protein F2P81_022749 [Scophthalmus maximus]
MSVVESPAAARSARLSLPPRRRFRPYNDMTFCLESASSSLGCYYPNPDTQDFFFFIHSHYFQNCTKEELVFEDAPHWVVMVLTLIPVSLIPVLVYLVVWKSKVQEDPVPPRTAESFSSWIRGKGTNRRLLAFHSK